jgi:hypothetical protein
MKQFVIGVLATIILGAAAYGLYTAATVEADEGTVVAEPVVADTVAVADVAPVADTAPVVAAAVAAETEDTLPPALVDVTAGEGTVEDVTAAGANGYGAQVAAAGQGNQYGQQGAQGQQGYGGTNAAAGVPQVQAQTHMTTTVTASGAIQAVELTGLSLVTASGEPLWVQLGQSRFWQSQGVTFNAGDQVTVTGFYENGQFQAVSVTNETTGQFLALRDEVGRPLWAGGRGRGQG